MAATSFAPAKVQPAGELDLGTDSIANQLNNSQCCKNKYEQWPKGKKEQLRAGIRWRVGRTTPFSSSKDSCQIISGDVTAMTPGEISKLSTWK